MKVFDIICEADGNVPGYTKSSGGVLMPNSNKGALKGTPLGDTIKGRIKASGPGKIEVTVGKEKFSGNPSKVLKEFLKSNFAKTPRGKKIAAQIERRAAQLKKARLAKGYKVLKGAAFLGAGLAAYDSWQRYSEEEAALKSFVFANIFDQSNLSNNQDFSETILEPYRKVFLSEIGVIVVGELVQLIKAGKILKLLKWARVLSAGAAATGVGLAISALIWAITEGAQWTALWWLRNYGADYFKGVAEEEMFDNAAAAQVLKNPDLDKDELKKQIKRDSDEKRKRAEQGKFTFD